MTLATSILILSFVGLCSGFIGSSVGGAGLIVLPTLLLLGLDPQTAIGTSTLSYIGISSVSLYQFKKHKYYDSKIAILTAITFSFGSIIGAIWLSNTEAPFLEKLIAYALISMAILSLIKSHKNAQKAKKPHTLLGQLLMIPIGIYKGAVGAGAGILVAYNLILLHGKSYMHSQGTRKLAALSSHITASIVYVSNGLINWPLVATLFISQSIGSYIGSHYAIQKGEDWLKYAFTGIVIISAIMIL